MVVTGPYYVEKPRYSGEHHAVTLKGSATVVTKGFTTPFAAQAYAAQMREQAAR